MSKIRTGSCHCGQVKIEVSAEDIFSFSCHCVDCMKLVSGGRLLGVGVPKDAVAVSGETKTYSYSGGSGAPINLVFCPKCSTQITGEPTKHAGTIVVRANMFDNQSGFTPGRHIFTETAYPWDKTE